MAGKSERVFQRVWEVIMIGGKIVKGAKTLSPDDHKSND